MAVVSYYDKLANGCRQMTLAVSLVRKETTGYLSFIISALQCLKLHEKLRQSSNTSQLLFNAFDLVEHLSTAFTLEPGDVISTGTPGGVAAAMKPPKWLKAGDVVKIAIDKLGEIENRVIAEPENTPRI